MAGTNNTPKTQNKPAAESDAATISGVSGTEESNQAPGLFVVGIGASAGGIEALEAFLSHVKKDIGCAFVVIQHLSPHFKSLMVEILEKHANLPVRAIENDLPLEANQIYIAPPGKNITIYHGKLFTMDQDRSAGFWFPIDSFLESLAEDYGERSIGVILSGTGSDGTHGGRLIKEKGGLFVAQDPDSAKFDGMPRSAINTGLVDQVMIPEEMPSMLDRYMQIPSKTGKKAELPERLELVEGVDRILAILKRQHRIDFSDYKASTIIRRIEHRMGINLIPTFNEYAQTLSKSLTESQSLCRELLIGVTRFFRDPESFEALKKNIPALFDLADERPTRAIRVWVAGCSTGEEAYSIAILLQDHANKYKNRYFDIKVFATDADTEAIAHAGAGLYPISIAPDVPQEYLQRYFVREGDHFRVIREIRQKVVFAPHDMINNAPFSRIDLVTCRNVLIYFKSEIQVRVLQKLAYALAPNGYLFLGSSESLGEAGKFFMAKDPTNKIFKFNGPTKPNLAPAIAGHPTSIDRSVAAAPPLHYSSSPSKIPKVLFTNLLIGVLGNYIPDSVIIDRSMRVLYCFGNTSTYMQLPTGQIDMSLANLVNPGIQASVNSAIQQALAKKRKIIFENITFYQEDTKVTFNLVVEPNLHGADIEWLMILFDGPRKEPISPVDEVQSFEADRQTMQRIYDLEYRLEFTEESLQTTIEELETSNEELQATNEELMAANEELQSTKEELHSTNEELVTVNSEYHDQIKEMSLLNDDIDNILRCSDISTILLDEDLRIRQFSKFPQPFIRLTGTDIGRPFSHFSHRIGELNLLQLSREVLEKCEPVDREIVLENGNWYLVRLNPYLTHRNDCKGVVLTFVETTTTKLSIIRLEDALEKEQMSTEALHRSEERIAQLMKINANRIVYCRLLNEHKRPFTFISSNVREQLGYTTEEFTENPDFLFQQIHPDDLKGASDYFNNHDRAKALRKPFEFRFKKKDGSYCWLRDEPKLILDDDKKVLESLGMWTDITTEKMSN